MEWRGTVDFPTTLPEDLNHIFNNAVAEEEHQDFFVEWMDQYGRHNKDTPHEMVPKKLLSVITANYNAGKFSPQLMQAAQAHITPIIEKLNVVTPNPVASHLPRRRQSQPQPQLGLNPEHIIQGAKSLLLHMLDDHVAKQSAAHIIYDDLLSEENRWILVTLSQIPVEDKDEGI